jgi:hypothetical protein
MFGALRAYIPFLPILLVRVQGSYVDEAGIRAHRLGLLSSVGPANSRLEILRASARLFEPKSDLATWINLTLPGWSEADRQTFQDRFLEGWQTTRPSVDLDLETVRGNHHPAKRLGRVVGAALAILLSAPATPLTTTLLGAGHSTPSNYDTMLLNLVGLRLRHVREGVSWESLVWLFLAERGVGKPLRWDLRTKGTA